MDKHNFYKHSIPPHQPYPGGPYYTEDYNYYVLCPHCDKVHVVEQNKLLTCSCGNRFINQGTILFIENFPHSESLCKDSCKAAKVVYRHNPLIRRFHLSSKKERKDFFEKMFPDPFNKRTNYGDKFTADDLIFFCHYSGNHWTDDSEFTVCPHCKSSVDVECNGPMVTCSCGKAFIRAGSDLFIEDFDGPCKCNPKGRYVNLPNLF